MKLGKALPHLSGGLAIAALAACSGPSYQQSLEPGHTTTNPGNATLQFAVGTANVAGTIGLNTLETLRQDSGEKGASVLINAPTIVGPSGFVVPTTPDAEDNAGTNAISGALQTSLASPPPPTTFSPQGDSAGLVPPGCPQGQTCYGIASSYGFFPGGVVNSNVTPDLQPYALPFYSAANAALTGASAPGPYQYIGGPPAFVPPGHTSTQDGTYTSGYPGFTLGFVDFQAVPVAGTYQLNVVIPTGVQSNGTSGTITKTVSASLSNLAGLPAWSTPPAFTPDGTGGGTIATNFAPGTSAITEEFIELVNVGVTDASGQIGATCQLSGSPPYYYTFEVTPGTASVTVPDSIGAAKPGVTQPRTFCTAADNGTAADGTAAGEDNWVVYGFAVDYPLIETAPPAAQGVIAPSIVGSSGQDDLTASLASAGPTSSGATFRTKSLRGTLHRL
jgi:hypothetical protein